jgi:hypothetical protein
MVLAFHGLNQPQADLANALGIDPEFGAPASRLTRLASIRLEVIYANGELDVVSRWIDRGLPVILFVQTTELAYWQGWRAQHAVVVMAIDDSAAIVFDPAFPATENPKHVARPELQLASDWLLNHFAVLRPR